MRLGEGDRLTSLSATQMDLDDQGGDDMPIWGQIENRFHDYVQDQRSDMRRSMHDPKQG